MLKVLEADFARIPQLLARELDVPAPAPPRVPVFEPVREPEPAAQPAVQLGLF